MPELPSFDRPLDYWRSQFGHEYAERNQANETAIKKRALTWGRWLWSMMGDLPTSIFEVGCNVGINLRALSRISEAELYALEPNDRAREIILSEGLLPPDRLFSGDASTLPLPDNSVDLSFTTGVLIHVPPSELPAAIDQLYRISRKYILMSEYFADKPEETPYRGQTGLLFKRDFGKLMLERHPSLRIVDYGFLWREAGAADNGNWWLFEKR
ncbi:pseudaminic acid biosynthesis-associated methylase [Woodsholea maritima]|uniref:pseudaminic acid biosynthesis-associated methylase n=1 Tax=Woodsholea maritima TaxID=240237 RepID=UPI00035E5A13|nr:pseudaminic acid biosynthesis-associated methylase [Woodsholea maritima]